MIDDPCSTFRGIGASGLALRTAIDVQALDSGASANPWLLAGGFLGLAIAFVGALTAASLLVYSPTKLSRQPAGAALAEHLDDAEHDYQVLGRLLAIAGSVLAGFFVWYGAGPFRGEALAIGFVLSALLCAVLPARIANARAEPVVAATIRLLRPVRLALHWPLLAPLDVLARLSLRVLRVPRDEEPPAADEIADDILAAVHDSAQEAALPDEERAWIENIVELKDQAASEIMTPRTDVVAFPREMPLSEAVHRAVDEGFSRYPVYEERIDRIVGVFYAKDALALIADPDALEQRTVGEIARPALFVPEGMNLVELLRQLRATKRGMAIVLDEYGGTSGLVSLEDVLEEIVGEIQDEYDLHEDPELQVVEPGHVIEVTGRTRVFEANEVLGSRIPEGEDYDTVAGYVFTTLDRIPKVGETVLLDGLEVRILEADARRIARMRLTLDESPQVPAAANGGATESRNGLEA